MSSLSASSVTPPGRTRIADGAAARLLAVFALCGFAFFAQADALSNRLSGPSPITLMSVLIAAIPAATLLVLLAPTLDRPRAIGGDGGRLILMLVAWAVFCWTLSDHKGEGLSYLIKFSTALGPALCLLIVADRPWHLHAVAWSMIAAATVSALVVLVEHKTGTRILSTAPAAVTADFDGVARSAGASDQNPTTAAQCLMTGAALALGLLFAGEKRWRILLVGAVAVGAVALVFMSARSAILGFGAGAGVVLLSLRHHRAFPLMLVAAALVGVVGLWLAPPTLWERFAAIGDFGKDQTLFRRITYLRIGVDLIGQSPVWGIGPGNFPLHYMLYEYRYLPGRILFPRELHNTYLDTATEYGLVGLAIFVGLVIHCLLALRRAMSPFVPSEVEGHAAWAASTSLGTNGRKDAPPPFVPSEVEGQVTGRASTSLGTNRQGELDQLRRVAFAVLVALVALLVGCFFMPHKDLRYLWLILAMAVQCGRLRAGELRA